MIPEKHESPYKVAYMFHGLHANQGAYMDFSMLPFYGKKYNVIFVMPEVGRSFYCDFKYGRNYFSFINEELPKICSRIFNISAKREDTAAIGYSMGGYGALKASLSKPEQYGFCGCISTACLYFKPILDKVRNDKDTFSYINAAESKELIKDLYAIYGEELKYKPENDILELIKKIPIGKPKPRIYNTCGTEDELLKENHKFRNEMINTDFDYTYEEWAGGHDWDFFNEGLKKTLNFWLNS
jgi:S-formylglutathione hydrolase FrmB